MIYLLIFGPLVTYMIVLAFLGNMYEKAGMARKDAITPGKNIISLFKMVERSHIWALLFFVPYINLILIIWLNTEMLKAFGYRTSSQQALGVFFGYFYLPYLSTKDAAKLRFEGVSGGSTKAVGREWLDAAIFAVVAASIIRSFVVEAYTIPTQSMEKSMLVGDFLFVSKFHYGPRVPNTLISIPFTHQGVPGSNAKPYFDKPQLPYYRLPGFQEVKRNDVVVFNYPSTGDNNMIKSKMRPVDKRTNYVKRCVAVAGDNFELRNGRVFVDGKPGYEPVDGQAIYYGVMKPGTVFTPDVQGEYDLLTDPVVQAKVRDVSDLGGIDQKGREKLSNAGLKRNQQGAIINLYNFDALSDATKQRLIDDGLFYDAFVEVVQPAGQGLMDHGQVQVFDFQAKQEWNLDNYGPVRIPKAGDEIVLTKDNYNTYKRLIQVYEGNELTKDANGNYYINGEKTNKYTVKMNYYWMMGDNRKNSADSRYWGFVPEDHIVGKPWFVWMSIDPHGSGLSKIRWSRLFSSVPHGDDSDN